MSFDGFTAGVLLSAVANGCDKEGVIDIAKSLQNKEDGPPTQEVINWITANLGKRCKIKYTSHIAVIDSVNMTDSGFYPGSRCPVFMKIVESGMPEAIGKIFEYELEQVELL